MFFVRMRRLLLTSVTIDIFVQFIQISAKKVDNQSL